MACQAMSAYVGLVAVVVEEQAEDILVPPLLRNCLTLNYISFSFPPRTVVLAVVFTISASLKMSMMMMMMMNSSSFYVFASGAHVHFDKLTAFHVATARDLWRFIIRPR